MLCKTPTLGSPPSATREDAPVLQGEACGEVSSEAASEASKARAPARRTNSEGAGGDVCEQAMQQQDAMRFEPGARGRVGHWPEHDATREGPSRGGQIASSFAHGSAMQMRSGSRVISERAREDQIKGIDQARGAREQQVSLTLGGRPSGQQLFNSHSPAGLAGQGSPSIPQLIVATLTRTKPASGQVGAVGAQQLIANSAMSLDEVGAAGVWAKEWQTAVLQEGIAKGRIRQEMGPRGGEPGHENSALKAGRNP